MLLRLLCLVACAITAAAHADGCPSPDVLRQAGVPGVVVADIVGNRVAISTCGLADVKRHRAMSERTVFQAASLSKPVFAMIALDLVREGKLDLDEPLVRYLKGPYRHDQNPLGAAPAWDTVDDPRLAKVTARMVLSHRSGLPNWAFGEPLSFVGEPGQRWNYSGEGYAYLATVVEAIAGKTLPQLAEERVFKPLGMRDSSYVWRDTYAGRMATGYDAKGEAVDAPVFRRPIAAASIYTTPADYARFVRALLAAAPGSLLARERESQVVVDDKYALQWGLGVGLEAQAEGTCAFHHGINHGYQSFFMVCPASGRGVLWFANSGHGLELAPGLLEERLPGRHPVLGWPVLHP
jgi:CubicO group peptidase (beta-lactamase class C family)